MKRGYRRLLIFEIILFMILFLNSFVHNILVDYKLILFLIVVLIIFYFRFGLEKDKHRYIKDIIIEVLIFLLSFFILYYLLGLIIGFYRADNYYNLYGIKTFILPVILSIILKEFLRYNILRKAEDNNILIVVSFLLFVFLDISNVIYFSNFNTSYDIFTFVALDLLPIISTNIVCTYLSMKMGYKPGIIYLLVINLYEFLIPILPNPNEYLSSLINFFLPLILCYRINLFFTKEKDKLIVREYFKNSKIPLISLGVFIIIIVYFTSGYFKYYAITVASGSMTPNILKGDVVIIEQLKDDYNYDNLEEGQVIAYRYDNIIVVHRIDRIIKEKDEYFIYTKGDANNTVDNYFIKEDNVIGIVKVKIPFIGLPTVWLNEL